MALTKVTYGLISADTSAIDLNIDQNTLYVETSGNRVGIGTTSPVSKLDVYNSSGTTPAFTTYNAGNSSDITSFTARAALQLICYQSEGNPYTKTSALIANADGTVPSEMQFWTKTNGASSAVERMRIDSSGNIGIGTASPVTPLHINSSTTESLIQMTNSSTGATSSDGFRFGAVGTSVALINREAGVMTFSTSNAERLRIDSSGNVGIGTTSPSHELSISKTATNIIDNPTLQIINAWATEGNNIGFSNRALALLEAGNGTVKTRIQTRYDTNANLGEIGTETNHDFRFVSNNIERARIDSSGNVGIGTTTPQTLFETATTGTTTNRLTVSSANEFSQIWVEDDDLQGILWKDGSDFTFGPAADTGGSGWGEYLRIKSGGNVNLTGSDLYFVDQNKRIAFNAGNSSSNKIGAWDFSSNAPVNPRAYIEFLGVQANQDTDIVFHTSTDATSVTEVMRITENQKVGIGTDSPRHKLSVNGTLGSSTYSGFGLGVVGGIATAESDDTDRAIGIQATSSTNSKLFSYDYVASAGIPISIQPDNADVYICSGGGDVGIGTASPSHKLHVHGGSADTNLVVSTNDNYKSEVRMMEDAAGTTHGGFIRYDGNGDYVQIGHYNSGTETMGWSMDDAGNIAVGATNASGHFEVHGGRMGIISTSSSWEQLRVANSSVAEAGIAIMNGCTANEFLADNSPSFSNAFTLAINPYGCGTDTLAVAHGNLGDSIWHIDGSGNFGYGPNTENPVSYYEISKTRPNVNAPSDYELKLTLNTYGYVGSGYKLGMLQFLGGDTATAQDNFYAGIGSTAMDGVNNSEEGSLDFHVRNGISSTNHLAMRIIGKAGTGIAGGGQHGKSVMFPYQGIAIDRVWGGYPGISVFNSSDAGTNQSEFRFHGTNSSSAAYPGTSGSDFSVVVRSDGGYATGSDRRRKRNITTIDNALATVKQLTGKRFQTVNRVDEVQEHVSKNGYKLGFIAQDVENIIPEAVQYHADEDDGTEDWNSAYSMDYGSVVALLVNAIKEQDEVIQDLKSRLDEAGL